MALFPGVNTPLVGSAWATTVGNMVPTDAIQRSSPATPLANGGIPEGSVFPPTSARSAVDGSRIHANLQASEISYRRLFEAARDGILILDAESGRIDDVNPFLTELLGFSHDEMVGHTVGELSPFKDIESNQAMLEALQERGYVRYENLPLETRGGQKIEVEFVSNVYTAGEHQVIQCNIRDISARRRTERQLAHLFCEISDLKFALDQHAIVSITDPSGAIISVNQKFCQISGYSRDELIGKDHRLVNSGFHSHEFMADLWATLETGRVWKGEIQNRARDRSLYWVDTTIVPFRNEQGEIRQYVAIKADITRHKAAEEQIRRLNRDLERRVVERTAQLQEANKELEAFSYSVSHDLRAPLRHILGFVQLLTEDTVGTLSEPNLKHLQTISQAAQRMGTLIDDLLAFSRVGRAEIQKGDVDLNRLLREVLAESAAERKGRKIEWRINPLPEVWVDQALMRIVLVNLMSNAVKFTGGKLEAIIEVGSLPGRDNETILFVRDNGAGFDPRFKDKLFGVFQRLHSLNEFEGTGIGLANVQRIIHRHGGKVWAEGLVDGGATLFLSLPHKPPEPINP